MSALTDSSDSFLEEIGSLIRLPDRKFHKISKILISSVASRLKKIIYRSISLQYLTHIRCGVRDHLTKYLDKDKREYPYPDPDHGFGSLSKFRIWPLKSPAAWRRSALRFRLILELHYGVSSLSTSDINHFICVIFIFQKPWWSEIMRLIDYWIPKVVCASRTGKVKQKLSVAVQRHKPWIKKRSETLTLKFLHSCFILPKMAC